MHLVPTPEEVLTLVRQTGALRSGHFEYRNGLHADQHLELPLALRYHDCAKILSVGLSRLLRASPEIRKVIPELSVVAATVAGLPVAHGVCEALRTRQVYWAEKKRPDSPMRFPPHLEQKPGEKVLLVDDILRSGKLLHEAKELVESNGGEVVGLAVLVYQPTPKTMGFGDMPLYYLVKLQGRYYAAPATCELCKSGVPLEQIEVGDRTEEARDLLLALGA